MNTDEHGGNERATPRFSLAIFASGMVVAGLLLALIVSNVTLYQKLADVEECLDETTRSVDVLIEVAAANFSIGEPIGGVPIVVDRAMQVPTNSPLR